MIIIKNFLIISFLALTSVGCYTIFKHPEVYKDGYSRRVKFYNDCSSCHSNYQLTNFGLNYHRFTGEQSYYEPIFIYISPYYSTPWWMDIVVPTEINTGIDQSNDGTRLRSMDGGRNSVPSDFSNPSVNTGRSGNSSSSSSVNQTTERKEDRKSRESESPKSRNNSGERK